MQGKVTLFCSLFLYFHSLPKFLFTLFRFPFLFRPVSISFPYSFCSFPFIHFYFSKHVLYLFIYLATFASLSHPFFFLPFTPLLLFHQPYYTSSLHLTLSLSLSSLPLPRNPSLRISSSPCRNLFISTLSHSSFPLSSRPPSPSLAALHVLLLGVGRMCPVRPLSIRLPTH